MLFFRKKSFKKYYNFLIKETKKDKQLIYGRNPKFENQENKLLDLFGHCDVWNKNIKMVIITDTHGCLKEDKFKEFISQIKAYDVCLLLGDHSVGDINLILKYIAKEKTYALLGNHDHDYIEEFGLNNLNGQVIDVNGVKLLGIQGSYRYKPEDFPSFSQKDSLGFLNDKEKVDILVCHDAPYGMAERNDVAHQGLFGILYYLFKNKVPLCIHGHLHTPYEKEMINGTKVICYNMCNYVEM